MIIIQNEEEYVAFLDKLLDFVSLGMNEDNYYKASFQELKSAIEDYENRIFNLKRNTEHLEAELLSLKDKAGNEQRIEELKTELIKRYWRESFEYNSN